MAAFDPITGITNVIGKLLDKWIPDADLKNKIMQDFVTQDFQLLLEQIKVNAIEAASGRFTWREAFGWTCAAAFAYKFVLSPMLTAMTLHFFPEYPVHKMPQLDWSELTTIAMGLLGLRTSINVGGKNTNG